jgi:hypothetical protein
MEEEFGADCQEENDANAGAVAEHRFGASQGTQNMVFLSIEYFGQKQVGVRWHGNAIINLDGR